MPITVSIVEDNEQLRGTLARVLNRADGFRCLSQYGDAESALEGLPRDRPEVVLMDINLPGLDGLAATRRIREIESLRAVPIVAVTAFGTEGFQRAAYDVGIEGYLTKPLDLDRMHQLIARLLSAGESGNLKAS